MDFYLLDFQNILVATNFFVLFIIFLYAFYLYSIEKKIRSKYSNIEKWASNIISSANHKALEVLTKSDYISNSLKREVTDNFDKLLVDLKGETKDFYKLVAHEQETLSSNFIKEISDKTEEEISEFGKEMTDKAKKLEENLDRKIEEDYSKAKTEIDSYKNLKMQEFEARMKENISRLSQAVFPEYITFEAQERLIKDILEKAKAEFENMSDTPHPIIK